MMPTYSIAKIAAEAVVRTFARELNLPTLIARLNTPYGRNGGWMYYHLMMMKNGVPIPVHSDAPSVYTPIHEDDIARIFPALCEHAKVPAEIVNVCGQDHVSIEEWCGYLGELCGLEPKFAPTEATLESVKTDNAKMVSLVGEATVDWKDGLARDGRVAAAGLARLKPGTTRRAQSSVAATKCWIASRAPGRSALNTSPVSGTSW